MVAGSILPITVHNGKVYFLFGKENALADTPGFSDFGGGVEKDEDPYITALREGGEELTGFLGDSESIQKHIEKNGGFYKILHNTYHIHLIYMDYWFTVSDMKKRKNEFRNFYQEIVQKIIGEVPSILKHFKKKTNTSRHTKKMNGGK